MLKMQEFMYRHRFAEKTLHRFLKAFPIVGITGPRQSGKSTLLQKNLSNYTYVTFDDEKNILFLKDDPLAFVKKHGDKVIFDEVQKVPKLFDVLKLIVDQNRKVYGQYILTGSMQFSFLESISESLAGRIGLFSLLPFQYEELPKALAQEAVYKGSYPELVMRDYYESELWYASYLETYLNKDLRLLSQVGDLRDFRRFVYLLAAQTAQIFDMTHFANHIGVSVPTIKRWVSLLEASYILFFLPPYHENLGKRIVKRPKLYFYDTGLVSYLTGIETYKQFDQGPLAGALFENYVISEILKKELHLAHFNQFYFYQTQDKAEIDLIIERKGKKDLIEIKKTSSLKPKMFAHLNRLFDEKSDRYLIYQGERDQVGSSIALPLEEYLKKIE